MNSSTSFRRTPAPRHLRDAPMTAAQRLENLDRFLMDAALRGNANKLATLVRKGADPLPLLNLDSTPGRVCILLACAKSNQACFDIVWQLMPASTRRAKIMMVLEKASHFSRERLLSLCAEIRDFDIASERIEQCLARSERSGQRDKTFALLSLFEPVHRFGEERATRAMIMGRCLCFSSASFHLNQERDLSEDLLSILDAASIDEQDANGRTLLAHAARNRHVPLCALLIELGANPFIADANGHDCIRHLEQSYRRDAHDLASALRARREAADIEQALGQRLQAEAAIARRL